MFRINSASNDLPWHFKVDSYPTVIFFPAGDKSNSVMFPRHQSLTLTNLVLFVHRSALSTFEMRICRPACVRSNLRIAINAQHQLSRRIRRLERSIEFLQGQLSAQLNASSLPSVELSSASSLVQPFVDTDTLPLLSDYGPSVLGEDSLAFAMGADRVLDKAVDLDSQLLKSNIIPADIPDSLRKGALSGGLEGRTTCEASGILQLREDLHLLRRRLYRYQEQKAFVRYVCRILSSASAHPRGHLMKRQWLQFQRERSRFVLKLMNFRDYVSGNDLGTTN